MILAVFGVYIKKSGVGVGELAIIVFLGFHRVW